MTAEIIDGRKVSAEIRAQVAEEVLRIGGRGYPPTLAILEVGENEAIAEYTRSIVRQAKGVGVDCTEEHFPADIGQHELIDELKAINNFMGVDGILVQFPLPKHLDPRAVADAISPTKDIEGISPVNAGKLYLGEEGFVPNTPLGGMELLRRSGVTIEGAEAVVVGRSTIVGRAMALLLLREHATVTLCHTRTRDLGAVTRRADILVTAAGRPGLVTADMIKPGATVIDFGTNPTERGTVGDVDYEAALGVAGRITPVPGGTGPVTTAMLFRSLCRACGR
jgi:methylenetetrahydrofolate dehydrogenase (NADP+)/methenyltetrahydrofolate cyclohydrolase